ncbi:hypothetical protein [Staphylococcus phage vB_ScaM-V1SC04]|nr:hypothetical protein [Staphylococcus phage vB_ScaM-V1SC04]
MIDILVIYYEETNKQVLKETIKTIRDHLNDEHGLVKMTATELSRENIEEEFNDYNIVIAKDDPDSFYSYAGAVEEAYFVIDIISSQLDIHAGVDWDVGNSVDILDRNPDFIDAIGKLNENLML